MKKDTIQYFMWGYQSLFRLHQKFEIQRLLQNYDYRLEPEVFLVGILADPAKDSDRYLACVDPEDDFWISSPEFNDILTTATTLRGSYKENSLFHSHPIANQAEQDYLHLRSIRDAIQQKINDHVNKPINTLYHVSFPVLIECYFVSVVIGIPSVNFDLYPKFQINTAWIHEYRSFRISISLIDSAIHVFLENSRNELQQQDPGKSLKSLKETDELLRLAGKKFIQDAISRIDINLIEGRSNIFSYINLISSLYYEKRIGFGSMIITDKDNVFIQYTVRFLNTTNIKDFRRARKLLELTMDNLLLISDSEKIYGLGSVIEYDNRKENVLKINFIGHHHWELVHDNNTLMNVQYGNPQLPKLDFNYDKLRIDLPRLFVGISSEHVEHLITLVQKAIQQPHGTILLITDSAESESVRLSTQATPIFPCRLTPDLLFRLTTIDGAIVLSPEGICYGIGVILDGLSTGEGDPGRGARYNSAIRYVYTTTSNCLAIVVSEDGNIDVIPELPIPLSREIIDFTIQELKAFVSRNEINIAHCNNKIEWLYKHNSYLLEDDCILINDLVKQFNDRLRSDHPTTVIIVREPLYYNPSFRKDWYYL